MRCSPARCRPPPSQATRAPSYEEPHQPTCRLSVHRAPTVTDDGRTDCARTNTPSRICCAKIQGTTRAPPLTRCPASHRGVVVIPRSLLLCGVVVVRAWWSLSFVLIMEPLLKRPYNARLPPPYPCPRNCVLSVAVWCNAPLFAIQIKTSTLRG